MLEKIADYVKGKPATTRSARWPIVRKAHLAKHPKCEACGSKAYLIVHHIHPVHLCPEGELCQENLITLCEGKTHNCHLWIGHLGNFKSYAADVREDAARFIERLRARPGIRYEL